MHAQVNEEIFESFKLQERRSVKYYIPEDYDQEKRYPLVIVLDAEFLFDQVVANSKFYSRFQGMPERLIVGISQSEGDLRSEDCDYELSNGLPAEKAKVFEFMGMEIIPYMVSATMSLLLRCWSVTISRQILATIGCLRNADIQWLYQHFAGSCS